MPERIAAAAPAPNAPASNAVLAPPPPTGPAPAPAFGARADVTGIVIVFPFATSCAVPLPSTRNVPSLVVTTMLPSTIATSPSDLNPFAGETDKSPILTRRATPSPVWYIERFPRLNNTVTSSELFKRSEEHTSELQSRSDLVCRLLLEKKKIKTSQHRLY